MQAEGGRSKKLLILSALFHGHVERNAGRWQKVCGKCFGDKCEACEQKGWSLESIPPAKQLGPEGRDLFEAYRLLKEYGAFPVAGGQGKQGAKFLEAVRLCDMVHSAYSEKAASERAEEERKAKRKVKLLGEL